MNGLRSKIINLYKSRGYSIASHVSNKAIGYLDITEQGVIVLPESLIGTDCVIE